MLASLFVLLFATSPGLTRHTLLLVTVPNGDALYYDGSAHPLLFLSSFLELYHFRSAIIAT